MARLRRKGLGVALACLILSGAAEANDPVIVDIRTPAEWRSTGVIEDALLLTFFARDGSHDAEAFVDRLTEAVGLDASIRLVCRTGRRTQAVMPLLERAGFRNVSHIEGGMTRGDVPDHKVLKPAPGELPGATRFGRIWRCTGGQSQATCRLVQQLDAN